MTKQSWILFALAASLFLSAAPAERAEAKSDIAFVDVAVATLWSEPNRLRELDGPSATNPVDLRKWTAHMDLADKLWLVDHLETQALFGQKVKILEERGEWVKVVVDGQPTPRHPDGYPGWMPKVQLVQSSQFESYARGPFIIVKRPTARLYATKGTVSPFMELSFATYLPVIKQEPGWVQVATPSDGDKWLQIEDIAVYTALTAIAKPKPDELVATAKMFLQLPYLWAGVSGFGFDCSGFTHAIYRSYGITIPRDASAQALGGTPVERSDLRPGDLLFFAHQNGKGRVHHVAMYIGNGEFIHSPKSERSVEILPITHPNYASEYAGARRYLP